MAAFRGLLTGFVALSSGASGLTFQMIWFREAGFLFGAGAESAAVTVSAFFLGLAGGSLWAARKAGLTGRPGHLFALLELLGILLALGALQLSSLYHSIFANFYGLLSVPVLESLIRFALAFLFFLPAAFCMGASFPFLVRWGCLDAQKGWAGISTLFYGLNILGGATGATLAGFLLPEWLGYAGTGILASAVGGLGPLMVLSFLARSPKARASVANTSKSGRATDKPGKRQDRASGSVQNTKTPKKNTDGPEYKKGQNQKLGPGSRWTLLFAGTSGFLLICSEVLFHRLLAAILQNSVYTFSTVLSLFLLLLGVAAFIAHYLIRRGIRIDQGLQGLLILSGIFFLLSPYLFYWIVGLEPVQAGSWSSYLVQVAGISLVVLGLPVVVSGTVFPFLFRSLADVEKDQGAPVAWLSRLLFWNLVGGSLGALFAAFLLLPSVGVRGGLATVASLYFGLSLLVTYGADHTRGMARQLSYAALALLIIQVGFIQPHDLPATKIDRNKDQSIIAEYEGATGTTAVVQQGLNRMIKVNNTYTLGDLSAIRLQQRQTDIPLLLHPDAKEIFYIGMGTGITPGSALRFDVEKVVVSELIPEVVEAARRWFSSANNDLFSDRRATVLSQDGRLHLSSHKNRYDLVICDLILPWRAGAGALYSRENFQIVKESLRDDGVFFLWLPLYQMSEPEFRIILNTFTRVFRNTVAFRADHSPGRSVLALAASNNPNWHISPRSMYRRARNHPTFSALSSDELVSLMLLYYAGNLSRYSPLKDESRVHTDDHPLVEFLASRSLVERRAGLISSMGGANYLAFLKALRPELAPSDPFLNTVPESLLPAVEAGYTYMEAVHFRENGDRERAKESLRRFLELLPEEASGIMLGRGEE